MTSKKTLYRTAWVYENGAEASVLIFHCKSGAYVCAGASAKTNSLRNLEMINNGLKTLGQIDYGFFLNKKKSIF
jgi:hypothetical protein